MLGLRVTPIAAATLVVVAIAPAMALAGPCSDEIGVVAKQLDMQQTKGEPNAVPSAGAPNPQRDLQRARELDANNDPACHDALRVARRSLGESTEGQPNGNKTN